MAKPAYKKRHSKKKLNGKKVRFGKRSMKWGGAAGGGGGKKASSGGMKVLDPAEFTDDEEDNISVDRGTGLTTITMPIAAGGRSSVSTRTQLSAISGAASAQIGILSPSVIDSASVVTDGNEITQMVVVNDGSLDFSKTTTKFFRMVQFVHLYPSPENIQILCKYALSIGVQFAALVYLLSLIRLGGDATAYTVLANAIAAAVYGIASLTATAATSVVDLAAVSSSALWNLTLSGLGAAYAVAGALMPFAGPAAVISGLYAHTREHGNLKVASEAVTETVVEQFTSLKTATEDKIARILNNIIISAEYAASQPAMMAAYDRLPEPIKAQILTQQILAENIEQSSLTLSEFSENVQKVQIYLWWLTTQGLAKSELVLAQIAVSATEKFQEQFAGGSESSGSSVSDDNSVVRNDEARRAAALAVANTGNARMAKFLREALLAEIIGKRREEAKIDAAVEQIVSETTKLIDTGNAGIVLAVLAAVDPEIMEPEIIQQMVEEFEAVPPPAQVPMEVGNPLSRGDSFGSIGFGVQEQGDDPVNLGSVSAPASQQLTDANMEDDGASTASTASTELEPDNDGVVNMEVDDDGANVPMNDVGGRKSRRKRRNSKSKGKSIKRKTVKRGKKVRKSKR